MNTVEDIGGYIEVGYMSTDALISAIRRLHAKLPPEAQQAGWRLDADGEDVPCCLLQLAYQRPMSSDESQAAGTKED